VVVADVPVGPGKTLYARFGDWFAWLCGLVALGGLVVGARKPSLSPVTTADAQV
jgi:apolipoprotein N-acyltransferase